MAAPRDHASVSCTRSTAVRSSQDRRKPMPIPLRSVATMIAVASALAACAETGPAYGPPSANAAGSVIMIGFQFLPETTYVKAGDTVEWRNQSSFTHSVNANPARFPDDVSIPAGAAPFDSG